MQKEGLFITFTSPHTAPFPVTDHAGAGFTVNGFLAGIELRSRNAVIGRIVAAAPTTGSASPPAGHLAQPPSDPSLPIIRMDSVLTIRRTALQRHGDSDAAAGRAPDTKVDPTGIRELDPLSLPIRNDAGGIHVMPERSASTSAGGNRGRSVRNGAVFAAAIVPERANLRLFPSRGRRIMKKPGRCGNRQQHDAGLLHTCRGAAHRDGDRQGIRSDSMQNKARWS